ncbi:MAG: phosphonate C-P lyase system protein PhnG [Pseudorhodoplanes sp.]
MANTAQNPSSEIVESQRRRREAVRVLAGAATAEIEQLLRTLASLPAFEDMRPAESGLLMLRGRIGGDGAPFNFGEATVSRATIRLESGETGFGYALGRDASKARLIALCDAMLQTEIYRVPLEDKVLSPLRLKQEKARDVKAQEIAATKVEFFTLVRGED